jgi:glycosyltransferase involved in cell wall biosynthesis
MAPSLCWIAHRDPTNPSAGGAERSILEICRELTARGWNVGLIAGGYELSEPESWLGGIRVLRSKSQLSLHLDLPALLRKLGRSDAIVEDLGHVVPFAAGLQTRTPGVVFFRHLHRRTLPGQVGVSSRLILSLAEAAYPVLLRRWPIVAPSKSAIEDLVRLGFDRARIELIEYGVDSSTFRPSALTAEPSLVYCSGLRPYKRPRHSLLVLKILRDWGINATLSVVGRGPELRAMTELTHVLGLTNCVEFTGWIPDTELARVLAKSWVHIQCSLAEGWGLTAWEAASSGVPTIAYRVPGLTDSVVQGVSGLLVPSGDVSALAAAGASIIHSRSGWTQRCREVTAGHTWGEAASKWDALLRRVVSRNYGGGVN